MPAVMMPCSKTVVYTGAAGRGAVGTVNLFAVTGRVIVTLFAPYCLVDLTQALATATIALGITGAPTLFIPATNAVDIDVGEWWFSAAPTLNGAAVPLTLRDTAINSDIINTIAAQNVNGGSIEYTVWWFPISPGAMLEAYP